MNHRIGSRVFGLVVGLAVAWWSYQWVTDPGPREERLEQERIVRLARSVVETELGLGGAEFVDPLFPERSVGKVYVYRIDDGWQVSGYYRRDESDEWHPWLATIGSDDALRQLRFGDSDSALVERAAADARLEALP